MPERHARFLKAGDRVRVDGEALGANGAAFGTITLVYPQIENGRVVADAKVAGLGDYFVGERIRVWVFSGSRSTVVVPSSYHRDAIRHRLRTRAQAKQASSTCRCSAGAISPA